MNLQNLNNLIKDKNIDSLSQFIDEIEYNNIDISENEFKNIISTLIDEICNTYDDGFLELLLDLLLTLLTFKGNAIELNFDKLISISNRFDKKHLEYFLYIIGFSCNKRYTSLLENYITTFDNSLKIAASNAFKELICK